jgi:hypothetical protein
MRGPRAGLLSAVTRRVLGVCEVCLLFVLEPQLGARCGCCLRATCDLEGGECTVVNLHCLRSNPSIPEVPYATVP